MVEHPGSLYLVGHTTYHYVCAKSERGALAIVSSPEFSRRVGDLLCMGQCQVDIEIDSGPISPGQVILEGFDLDSFVSDGSTEGTSIEQVWGRSSQGYGYRDNHRGERQWWKSEQSYLQVSIEPQMGAGLGVGLVMKSQEATIKMH